MRSDSKYNALITMLDILTHINLYDKGSILNKCFFIKKDHSVRVWDNPSVIQKNKTDEDFTSLQVVMDKRYVTDETLKLLEEKNR